MRRGARRRESEITVVVRGLQDDLDAKKVKEQRIRSETVTTHFFFFFFFWGTDEALHRLHLDNHDDAWPRYIDNVHHNV